MIYDELITEITQRLSGGRTKSLPVLRDDDKLWPSGDGREMILRSDSAYELGGGALPGLGITAVTMSESLIPSDGLSLAGPDLQDIRSDAPFARIALIRVNRDISYRLIKDLDFTKYHFSPYGFMLRISAMEHRECVRVSRNAVRDGISFDRIGSLMIKAFHENKAVEAVRLYFVTDESFDFGTLKELERKSAAITEAIEHIGTMPDTDCAACGLRSICDEVEGLRQLHFNKEVKDGI